MTYCDLPIGSIWRPSSSGVSNVFEKRGSENLFVTDKNENIFELGFLSGNWYSFTNGLAPALYAVFSTDEFASLDDVEDDECFIFFVESTRVVANTITLDQSDNELEITV